MKKMFSGLHLLPALLLIAVVSCKRSTERTAGAESSSETATVFFYNTENLFDTADDPTINDDDFTPQGKLMWTDDRLLTKLDRIAEVIQASDQSMPDIIGLCEVENRLVLEMLVKQERIIGTGYGIIHQDSPDERGIDVALLYDPATFRPVGQKWLPVVLDNPEDPNTRDILYVSGDLNGETIHVFVNHWPSRGGGQEKTEPYRIQAATVLRREVNKIYSESPSARIIVMGDFNDHPSDRSIREMLQACPEPSCPLVNMMAKAEEQQQGSHWYRGEWGALDQFIVSRSMTESSGGWVVGEAGAEIMKRDFVLFTDGEGNKRPNRTFAGDDYKGGYSDHLAIALHLVRK